MAYTTAELKQLAKEAAAAGATADDIAKFVSDQGIDPAQVAEVYNVTEESVNEGLAAYKSGGSAKNVAYTPAPAPKPKDEPASASRDTIDISSNTSPTIDLGGSRETVVIDDTPYPDVTVPDSNKPSPDTVPTDNVVTTPAPDVVTTPAPPGLGPTEPLTLDSGYTLTPEEEEYRGNLSADQQPVYDLLLNNKGKSNEEITKALVEQGIPIDKAFAVVGITDPEVQAPFKAAYKKAQAEAGLNPSFDTKDYDAYMANAKALVDSGAITEEQAYENMLIEVKRLREEGYSITDEELAESINKTFGQTLSPEDVTNFIAGTPEEPEQPLEPVVLEELGTLDGTPVEAAVGNVVPGVPQVGEVNILDYMGLQAGKPTLPVGTKLSTQIKEVDGEAVGTKLSDISTLEGTKLSTDGTYVAEPEDVTAKQVTSPTPKDAITGVAQETDLVEQPDVAKMTAAKSLEQINAEADALQAARQDLNEIDPKATVQGQLALLQEQFANERTPVWAQGAMKQVNALMAQRGLGSSTIAAEAITNALMQSAMPIAQQDASFYQNVTIQNLSNEQQAVMARFSARTQAIFNDQAAENAARSLNTQSENDLNKFFTEMAQQVALSNTEQVNSMEKFNATAQNNMMQFFEELGLTAETFNAEAVNDMAMFSAEQATDVAMFNATMKNQREQYNVNNQLQIDANNVQWRREVNLSNTAATNAALQVDAQNLLAINQTALNNIWNHYDTLLNFAFERGENALDRATNLALATMQEEMAKQIAEAESDAGLIGGIFEFGSKIIASDTGKSLLQAGGFIET